MSLTTTRPLTKLDPKKARGLFRITTTSGSEYLVVCGARKASGLAFVTNERHHLDWQPLLFEAPIRTGECMAPDYQGESLTRTFGPTMPVETVEAIGISEIKPNGPEKIYHISTAAGKFELMITRDPQDVAIIEALDDQAAATLRRHGLPTDVSFNCNFGVGNGEGRSSCNADLKVGEEATFGLHKTGGKYFTALVTGIEPQE